MKKNKEAVIVLHEIYGINTFIEDMCERVKSAGFDVICPNMIGRVPFPYEQSQEAYDYFTEHAGPEIYRKIRDLIYVQKQSYEKIFVLGFSAGATLAWRCCEDALCDGIVACYGSRIRDYTELNPVCPTLLLFAREPSFDVNLIIHQLQGKPHLEIFEFDAEHGFMDPYSAHFSTKDSIYAEALIFDFLRHLL